jgi:ubiquinone/menaquinone biosynthesis C-methylase UbiE
LAAVYDALNPWSPSDEFYLTRVMRAGSVLDVGCGTGSLLCRARGTGHRGHLVGADPAEAMLAMAATKRSDVTWLRADARALDLGRRFELVTMTGHAFQVLLDDAGVRAALGAYHRHLDPGGRLAFETRNPAARAWRRWTPEHTRTGVRSPAGEPFTVWHDLRGVDGDLVRFVTTYRSEATGETLVSPSTLRFVDPDRLRSLLTGAGFTVDGWYGDWDGGPVTDSSPEIVVTATRG